MRVLVLGPSSDQGLPLLAALQAAGYEAIAGVRRYDAMEGTPSASLPTREADLDRPETLKAAFSEIDALAFSLPFTFDRALAQRWGQAIADAARDAQVRRIIFNTACVVADADIGVSGHDARRDIEILLETSGAYCTFIEPTVFMDNMIRPWAKPSIAKGVFAYPAAPSLKIGWICLEDVASAMVAALPLEDLPLHIALGGPEALTGDEVADSLSRVLGKPVRFQSLDPQDFAASMSELVTGSREVAPHSLYDGMARFYRWYNDQPASPLVGDPRRTSALLGIKMTRFEDWARAQTW